MQPASRCAFTLATPANERLAGNSASGSKYYNQSDPAKSVDPNYGPDPLNPDNYWANSVEDQEHVRTYVKVQVRKKQLVVENIRSGTCAAPNAPVELGQESWCGPDDGASAAQPVGSKVDKVVIHGYDGKDGHQPPTPPMGQHDWTMTETRNADGQETRTLTAVS